MSNYSGTITADATAQVAAAADPMRNTLILQNPSDTEMFYSFGATAVQASPAIQFSAGDTHFWPQGFQKLISQQISIIGPTATKAFTIFDSKR